MNLPGINITVGFILLFVAVKIILEFALEQEIPGNTLSLIIICGPVMDGALRSRMRRWISAALHGRWRFDRTLHGVMPQRRNAVAVSWSCADESFRNQQRTEHLMVALRCARACSMLVVGVSASLVTKHCCKVGTNVPQAGQPLV